MMNRNRPGAQQRGGMMGGPGPGMGMPVEKARDFRGTMRKLIAYIGVYRINIGIVLLFAIA